LLTITVKFHFLSPLSSLIKDRPEGETHWPSKRDLMEWKIVVMDQKRVILLAQQSKMWVDSLAELNCSNKMCHYCFKT